MATPGRKSKSADPRTAAIHYPEFSRPRAGRRRFAVKFQTRGGSVTSPEEWRYYHWLRVHGTPEEIRQAEESIARHNWGLFKRSTFKARFDDGGTRSIAFIRAIRLFNPLAGIAFSTYATTAMSRLWSESDDAVDHGSGLVNEGTVGDFVTLDPRNIATPAPPLLELLETLDWRRAYIVGQHRPIDDKPKAVLTFIGVRVGVSKERTRQLEAAAYRQMKITAEEAARFEVTPRAIRLISRIRNSVDLEQIQAAVCSGQADSLWALSEWAARDRVAETLAIVADILEMGERERAILSGILCGGQGKRECDSSKP